MYGFLVLSSSHNFDVVNDERYVDFFNLKPRHLSSEKATTEGQRSFPITTGEVSDLKNL